MTQRLRCRGWCFTINNDTFEDLDSLLELDFQYLIIGFEIGENKTRHIQGYIHYENQISFKSIKRDIPRAHIEMARGTPKQNFKYCSKDGDFYEFGDRPVQGARTDLNEIKELLLKKTPMKSISDQYFGDYIRYHKGFERYRDLHADGKVVVSYVDKDEVDFNIPDCLYVSKEGQLWGYDNEETIVILRQKSFDTYQLMMLEKGHPYLLGSKKILPGQVIIVKQ